MWEVFTDAENWWVSAELMHNSMFAIAVGLSAACLLVSQTAESRVAVGAVGLASLLAVKPQYAVGFLAVLGPGLLIEWWRGDGRRLPVRAQRDAIPVEGEHIDVLVDEDEEPLRVGVLQVPEQGHGTGDEAPVAISGDRGDMVPSEERGDRVLGGRLFPPALDQGGIHRGHSASPRV